MQKKDFFIGDIFQVRSFLFLFQVPVTKLDAAAENCSSIGWLEANHAIRICNVWFW